MLTFPGLGSAAAGGAPLLAAQRSPLLYAATPAVVAGHPASQRTYGLVKKGRPASPSVFPGQTGCVDECSVTC